MKFAAILFACCIALSACGDNLASNQTGTGGSGGQAGKPGTGGTGGSGPTGAAGTGGTDPTGSAGATGGSSTGGTTDSSGIAGNTGSGGSDSTGTAGATGSGGSDSTGAGGTTDGGSSLPPCKTNVASAGGTLCQNRDLSAAKDSDGLVYVQSLECTRDCQLDVSATFNSGGIAGPVQHLTNSCPDPRQNNHRDTCDPHPDCK